MAHQNQAAHRRRAGTPPSTPVFTGFSFDNSVGTGGNGSSRDDEYDLDMDDDLSPSYETMNQHQQRNNERDRDRDSPVPEQQPQEGNLNSDLDESAKKTQALTKDFTTVLTQAHQLLSNIQATLESADEKAISLKVKVCIDDCARIVEGVAMEIESRGEDGRREMCERMTMEVQREIGRPPPSPSDSDGLVDPQEEQFLRALSLAPSILQDVSSSMRAITDEEAAELTEVGMTVSLIFLSIAKGAVESVDVDGIVGEITSVESKGSKKHQEPRFERLDSDGNVLPDSPKKGGTKKKRTPLSSSRLQLQRRQPLVFWPRIVPFLQSIPQRMAEDFGPVISSLLLALMSPTLVITGFVMSPLILTDEFIHTLYENLKKKDKATIVKHGSSSLQECEIATARALEILKLNYLITKLTVKQSFRVAKRQLKRQGGVIGIAKTASSQALDCAIHPVATVGWVLDRTAQVTRGAISLFGIGVDLVKGK
jgi:hypothetical protein